MARSIINSELLALNGLYGQIESDLEGLACLLIVNGVDWVLDACNDLMATFEKNETHYLQIFMLFFESLDLESLNSKCIVPASEKLRGFSAKEETFNSAIKFFNEIEEEWNSVARIQRNLMSKFQENFEKPHPFCKNKLPIRRTNEVLYGFRSPDEFMRLRVNIDNEINRLLNLIDISLSSHPDGDVAIQFRELLAGISRLKELTEIFQAKKVTKEQADKEHTTAKKEYLQAYSYLVCELGEMKRAGKLALLHGNILQLLEQSDACLH